MGATHRWSMPPSCPCSYPDCAPVLSVLPSCLYSRPVRARFLCGSPTCPCFCSVCAPFLSKLLTCPRSHPVWVSHLSVLPSCPGLPSCLCSHLLHVSHPVLSMLPSFPCSHPVWVSYPAWVSWHRPRLRGVGKQPGCLVVLGPMLTPGLSPFLACRTTTSASTAITRRAMPIRW